MPLIDEEAEDAIQLADDMLGDESYEFATETISGIKDNILKFGRVTAGQQKALDNIYSSVVDR